MALTTAGRTDDGGGGPSGVGLDLCPSLTIRTRVTVTVIASCTPILRVSVSQPPESDVPWQF